MQWIVHPALERPKIIHARMYEDDVVSVTADMNSEASRLGTSVSTATWTTESGNISIGSKALSSNVATAQFTAPDIGTSWVKVVLEMVDGQKFSQLWTIKVTDPTIPIFSTTRSIFGVP